MFNFLKKDGEKKIEKALKHFKESEEKYTHHLDEYIVDTVKNPLIKFIKYQEEHGFHLPNDFKTDPNAWLITLNKMKFAFEQKEIQQKGKENKVTKNMNIEQLRENKIKIQEGFELFGKYLQDLLEIKK